MNSPWPTFALQVLLLGTGAYILGSFSIWAYNNRTNIKAWYNWRLRRPRLNESQHLWDWRARRPPWN